MKLAMHPICYVFIVAFPFMILIPSYPLAIGFIYVLSCYPILFLGANKGQQSNDLLYSVLLPIRKKDIVKARIFTVLIMQVAFIAIMSILVPVALAIGTGTKAEIPGLDLNGYVSVVSIAIIGYALADLIYFSIYYKSGKSIVASTLLTILGFVVYLGIFTIAIPYIPGFGESYKHLLNDSGVGIQFVFLGAALVITTLLHLVVYKVASRNLENLDL